jgi:signal transduction histidine kinase
MSPVTIVSSMVVGSCLTLALVHAGVWWRDRSNPVHLAFSITVLGVALFGCCEFAMMRAQSIDAYGLALRWAHIPILMMVWGVVSFVGWDFGTGRAWLARAAWGLSLLTTLANFWYSPNADYTVMTGIRSVHLFGEPVTLAEGVTGPWHWIGQVSHLFVLAFCADAALRLWRTGSPDRRRRALVIGGGMSAFVVLGAGQAALIFAGLLHQPHIVALAFVPVLLGMGFELSSDVFRAARLAGDLRVSLLETERQMRLAAQAEAATRDLSSRLIDAQEDERRRLARELHDDFSQRLALVSVRLQVLRPHAGDRAASELDRVSDDVRELASDVHRFAHQLHPAKLDQLGLATAVRSWCRELTQQSGLSVDALVEDVPATLPPDVALCAYRVVQEATQNAVRHSGGRTILVRLSMPAGILRLTVEDDGHGFDVEPARLSRGGLGLVSMRERVRPLGGTLAVESRPGHGTRLELGLPLPPVDVPAVSEARS